MVETGVVLSQGSGRFRTTTAPALTTSAQPGGSTPATEASHNIAFYACTFIEESVQQGKPFYVQLNLHAIHNSSGGALNEALALYQHIPDNKQDRRKLAQLTTLDNAVQIVREKLLRELNVHENTMLVFSSDHGMGIGGVLPNSPKFNMGIPKTAKADSARADYALRQSSSGPGADTWTHQRPCQPNGLHRHLCRAGRS